MRPNTKIIIRILQFIIAPLSFFLLWSIIAPKFYLPNFMEVLNAFIEMVHNNTLFHDILISSYRALLGFFIGYTLGVFFGVLSGRYITVMIIIGGVFLFLRWTPVLAILPLTVRIGGLGEMPKIFLIAWACFFLSWIYTHVSVNKMKRAYIWWSDSLGLNLFQRIFKVYLPAISPSLIGAARASLAIALIVVVAAELNGTLQSGFFRDGLGYRISRAIETNRNDINIACIITFGFLGLLYDFIFMSFIKHIISPITKIDFYHSEG